MRAPVVAEQREGGRGERDVAVVTALSGHMDEQAGTVHLGHLEAGAFREPQATGIDGDETDPVDGKAHEGEDAPDLLATEDDGQRVRLRRTHQRQARERLAERVLDEDLMPHSAMVTVARAACWTWVRWRKYWRRSSSVTRSGDLWTCRASWRMAWT